MAAPNARQLLGEEGQDPANLGQCAQAGEKGWYSGSPLWYSVEEEKTQPPFSIIIEVRPGYLPVKQLRLYYPNLLSIHSQWMMRGQEDAEIQAADARQVSRTEMLFRLLQDVCDTEILLEKTACQQYQEAKAYLVGLNRGPGRKISAKEIQRTGCTSSFQGAITDSFPWTSTS